MVEGGALFFSLVSYVFQFFKNPLSLSLSLSLAMCVCVCVCFFQSFAVFGF